MNDDGHDHAGHDHDHAGHSHDLSADADRRYLTIAVVLIVGFMAFETVVGIVAHSLALLSDAAHMLTDAGALALSFAIIRFVQRSGGEALTYGRRRAAVPIGQANSAVVACAWRAGFIEAKLAKTHHLYAFIGTVIAGLVIGMHRIRSRRRDFFAGCGGADVPLRDPASTQSQSLGQESCRLQATAMVLRFPVESVPQGRACVVSSCEGGNVGHSCFRRSRVVERLWDSHPFSGSDFKTQATSPPAESPAGLPPW